MKEQPTEQVKPPSEPVDTDDITQTTKSGRVVKPPTRYVEQC